MAFVGVSRISAIDVACGNGTEQKFGSVLNQEEGWRRRDGVKRFAFRSSHLTLSFVIVPPLIRVIHLKQILRI